MINEMKQGIISTIGASLWDMTPEPVGKDVFDEMCRHAIETLVMPKLSSVALDPELYDLWEKRIIQHLSYNARYEYAQNKLPIDMPYVILKGTAAAQYYPYPRCRMMGDIDIMTRREDFEVACNQFLEAGYKIYETGNRETGFEKNGIRVEVHRYFGSFNKEEQVKYLDDLIIDNINKKHILPDLINGIVLLEHFSQHLENGIGLRQTIDWMMYVDKCLNDKMWSQFRIIANKLDLEKLAVILTRMCEIYLGLPRNEWASSANINLCETLFEYILDCGNFGNKRTTDEDISINAFSFMRSPSAMFKLLQNRGLKNWNLLKEHPNLQSFAWLYQALRYLFRGFNRDNAISKITEEYSEAQRRNKMMNDLGIKRNSNGLISYINGEYVKRDF